MDASVAAARGATTEVTSDKNGQVHTEKIASPSIPHKTNANISKSKLLQEPSDDSSTSSEEDTMEEYLRVEKRTFNNWNQRRLLQRL